MVRIMIHGCNGAMGQAVGSLAKGREDVAIVAGIDINALPSGGYRVCGSVEECDIKAEGVVDLSSA